ncbi:MAG TPA: acyl-CoA carboxylase subunit epsilon [Streptosporangiaceae bacterium]
MAPDRLGGDDSPAPLLTVVRGEPTPAELAAVTVVIGTRAAQAGQPEPSCPRSVWASPASKLRPQLHPGPGAWRASALPR